MATRNKISIPFKATHPGEILGLELKERGIKQKDFAEKIQMQPTHLNALIKGNRNLTEDVAIRLEETLGISFKTWMNLQANYTYDCTMIEKRTEEERNALNLEMDYNKIINLNELYKWLNINCLSCNERINELNRHIKLDILHLSALEAKIQGYFKHSEKLQIDEKNMRTWLVEAWTLALKVQTNVKYCSGNAILAAQEIAEFANNEKLTVTLLKDCLNKNGISYYELEKLEKTPIDAYSTITGEHPVIIVTYRINDLDKLAFDVLHELCHIDKHIDSEGDSYISIEGCYSTNPKEKEANEFAKNLLIPPTIWENILKTSIRNLSPYAVVNAIANKAKQQGISPSIAVARYKHDSNNYNIKPFKSPKIFISQTPPHS